MYFSDLLGLTLFIIVHVMNYKVQYSIILSFLSEFYAQGVRE